MTKDEFFDNIFAINPPAYKKLHKLYYRAKHDPEYADEINFVDTIEHADTPSIAIHRMFLWVKTPEGVRYWTKLCDDLDREIVKN